MKQQDERKIVSGEKVTWEECSMICFTNDHPLVQQKTQEIV
jgi:hypothetical protein